MPFPTSVRVKLSSEVAESISITPVVVRDIPIRELIEHMIGITGKDESRLHDLLLRGTLVSGASRFRWTGWDADREAIREALASFPDPDPERRFAPELCIRAALRGPGRRIEIPREIGQRKPLFRRSSFWDTLMGVAASSETPLCGLCLPRARGLLFGHALACGARTAAGKRAPGEVQHVAAADPPYESGVGGSHFDVRCVSGSIAATVENG